MTIIESAVKRLEKTRRRQSPDPAEAVVGEVVEHTAATPETVVSDAVPATGIRRHEGVAALAEAEAVAAHAVAGADSVPAAASERAGDEPVGSQRIVRIDRDKLRASGLLAPEEEERQIVDQYRHIKRPLIAHAFGKRATRVEDGHLIMVASALAGEGKTFTCLNLALSMARERDVTVLLVDADVAKPHISRLFGADEQPGLLDALDDPAHYDHRSVVMATDVPGLALMPAGAARPHASELLASDRMEALAARLGEEDPHRVVLFDSPPLLQTSEARILATVVGQVALVVCAGVTPQHVVLDAVSTLQDGKAVNLILNQARYSGSDGYYGGYHVYGSYGGQSAEEARA
jgi:exopolysaccharide/PEP-CTERM locus tyrosine autokinase